MRARLVSAAAWLMRSRRRTWLAGFAVFFGMMACWSMATPIAAAPDEPAHIIRAASVARGQISDPEKTVVVRVGPDIHNESVSVVTLPQRYESLNSMYKCYAFFENTSAHCGGTFEGSSTPTEMTTAAGRYNPVYYWLIGWPSLLTNSVWAIYGMRLMTAVLCAALLGLALVACAEWRHRGVALVGLFAAATPMTLFLGGVVNPSSVEASAGILAWSAILPVFMAPDPRLLARRVALAGVATTALFLIRPLGLVWVLAVVVIGLLVSEREAVRGLLRRRVFWLWSSVVGASFVFGEVWDRSHPDHSTLQSKPPTALHVARETLLDTGQYVEHMIGDFGWLDSHAPYAVYLLWPGVVLTLVLLAMAVGQRREVLALLAVSAGIVVVPVLASAATASTLGAIWQGRYLLPFAAGLPLLAAMVIAKRDPLAYRPRTRLVRISCLVLTGCNALSFYWALHRYMVGAHGSFLPGHAGWDPPGGWLLWLAPYVLFAAVQALLLVTFDRVRPAATGGSTTGPELHHDGPRWSAVH